MMRKLSSTDYKSLPESQIASAQQLNLRILESDTGTELPQDMAEFNAKYTELSQVGAGGFGSVHLFQDKETGELVAAKRLRQPKQLVRAEASVLFKLIKSTFIVKVCKQIPLNHLNNEFQFLALYESPDSESRLVTEYLSGGDLVTRYVQLPQPPSSLDF